MRLLTVIATSFIIIFFNATSFAEEAREIDWDTLLPDAEKGGAAGGYADENVVPLYGDTGPGHTTIGIQTGSSKTVDALDGAYVRIPGFMLPLEYAKGGIVTEFLLVPYFGACIHVPPPPPNQIVYVTTQEPVKAKGMWDPIWAVGTLRTQMAHNDLGDAAYSLELDHVEAYDE